MPDRIIVLPRETADRIAAGEVIERPSSIVKELIENALDAGATEITTELEGGGTASIKVTDNGAGIDRDDIALAFGRHATSKILSFDDLYRLTSFGFRGEALPSIAAVSTIEMVTRKRKAMSGWRVRVEEGRIVESLEIGCPEGTSVLVTDIFKAIPVRRKFLKKESAEQAHCLDLISRTILPHSRVRARVLAGRKTILVIPASDDLAERFGLITTGVDVKQDILAVDGRRGRVSLRGFISRPDVTRSTSKNIFCYVNGRYVRDALVNHAVMTGYRNMIEARRYPLAVLMIHLPPEDVDVNVHPAKMEVRFRHPRDIYEAVLSAVLGTLARSVDEVQKREEEDGTTGSKEGLPGAYGGRIEEAMRRYASYDPASRTTIARDIFTLGSSAEGQRDMDALGREYERGFFASLQYLGRFDRTYLIFAHPRGIVILDQHAAHERILLEKLKGEAGAGKIACQSYLIPDIVNLAPGAIALLEDTRGLLEELGIHVEAFGGDAVRIISFPECLSHLDPGEVIRDILDELSEIGRLPEMTALREKILIVMACKGAVKAREGLERDEIDALCRDLDAIPFATTCPHGRPVLIRFGIKDLEKLFKRT